MKRLTKAMSEVMKQRGLNALIGVKSFNANLSFEESKTKEAFIVNASSKGYSFDDDSCAERIFKSFIAATSTYLSKVKVAKEDEAVALVLTDINGVFKFAGVVEYHENEENKDEPGNWSYVLTLNEQDLTDLENSGVEVKKYLYGDDAFKAVLDKVAYDIGGIEFTRDSFMYNCCTILISTILQVLDSEAIANETVDIELKGYAVFSVSVEKKSYD